jgi:hypothetical protein
MGLWLVGGTVLAVIALGVFACAAAIFFKTLMAR